VPFLGNYNAYRRDPLAFYLRLGRCGDICQYRMLGFPSVFINTPALIQSLLVEHAADYDKGLIQRAIFRPLVGNGLVNSEGALHARQRKLLAPAFQPRHLAAYADSMVVHAERWQARWADGDRLDVHAQMMALTMQVVSDVLLGADVSARAAEISAAINGMMPGGERTSTTVLSALLPRVLPTPTNRRLGRAVRAINAIVDEIIAAHQAAGTAEEPGPERGDVLTMLLQARDDEGRPMSAQQVRDEVLTFFLAGHETTALALTWSFYLLAQHAEVTARLHAELDSVLDGRPPAGADLSRLPYTLQVLKEALRLYPPSSAIVRVAVRDTVLGEGYPIRKNTAVTFSQYVLHRRPDSFPDPEHFDPERFRPENEQRLPRYAYLPFGAGHRICIGNHFALMEGHLLLATIAQRLHFALAMSAPIRPTLPLTLRPIRPVMVMVTRRTGHAG
jgi:cytochrome P450